MRHMVRLETEDGGFVHEQPSIFFTLMQGPPPLVVFWGTRVFFYRGSILVDEDGFTRHRYMETFFYALVPEE